MTKGTVFKYVRLFLRNKKQGNLFKLRIVQIWNGKKEVKARKTDALPTATNHLQNEIDYD